MLGTVATLTASQTYTGLGALPHFNPDDDRDPLHPEVAALREAIKAADAILICTPEYAGGLPGSFKNLLDWTVGGGEIYGKPVAWINASSIAAPTGGRDAHDTLRKVLTYAGAKIVDEACARIPVSRADVADGQVADPDLRGRIAMAVRLLRDGV
ncbi:NADPH-dependent FMN reductase [Amycolatopsis eburnea]|uniref:NAD(P)H-dependent oxidoreductase n=1 Tax=Amycolatopsis eburnea TaxID=2267691 RepID=A0A3R9DYX7_9PSEU|nr:NADPH-dependent FMN reductase [Amycolatopsis eburnea]RSD20349.1 NAD(P)H-dependent oxidoreductase [Amycolatopsis eburnea]